jgi:hypothetical protein
VLHVRASSIRLLCYLSLAVIACFAACSRSELDFGSPELEGGANLSDPDAAAVPATAAASQTGEASEAGKAMSPDPCANAPPIPCPGGGFQYCVVGRYSDCPTRCIACIPGGKRVCFNTYCNFWGGETCTADGQAFGNCVEHAPPPQCEAIAKEHSSSPELEQCCIDQGYCCKDEFDLNHNGITNESIGQCGSVSCK